MSGPIGLRDLAQGALLSLVLATGLCAGESGESRELQMLQELQRKLEEQAQLFEKIQEDNAALRREMETMQRKLFDLEEDARAPGSRTREPEGLPDLGSREAALRDDPLGQASDSAAGRGGIFDKPFLRRLASTTHLGGYLDLEYRDEEDSNRTFRQHRFVPFIYSQVTEQVRVAAEIEFEDGGTDSAGDDGETKVEFAVVDWVPDERMGLRAGAILVPLGKFNLMHDSPTNDLTDRPLVDTFVIPTTLTEAGVGTFGTLYPSEESKLDYELYLVNGFSGLEENDLGGFESSFDDTKGLRDGRASLKVDNNNSVAGVGRIALSPVLGVELGASGYVGKYDDKGDNDLVIGALDGTLQPGRFFPALAGFELQGEIARAEISRNSVARSSGVPDDMWGYYAQLNYHWFPEMLRDQLPKVFLQESTFTSVVRLDHVELDDNRRQRITFGFNFRPIEDTVFKFDYQLNFEDWDRQEIPNDAFIFSVATYF